jgi:glycosyltransferase involved in cell wall biosynthesis
VRLLYLTPVDIQLARVDRQCIVSFCQALRDRGVQVELIALRIRILDIEIQAVNPLDLYGVRGDFAVRLVRVPVGQESSSWWIALNRFVVHIAFALDRAVRRSSDSLVIYEKSYAPALAILLLRRMLATPPLLAFEAHLPPRRRMHRFVLRRADAVIANTHALARELVNVGAVSPSRVIGTHQGVDLAIIEAEPTSKSDARAQTDLPLDKKLVVYTGKIYWGYEEVESILQAARLLCSRDDITFVLVGGREDHVQRFRRRLEAEGVANVRFVGFVRPAQVHAYRQAADVLVLYYPSGMELNEYRSPGKLFPYMASGRPIVSVDLPVVREVLGNEPAAVMVPPDSPRLLAAAIARVVDHPESGERLGQAALKRVRAFTWDARARAILDHLSRNDPARSMAESASHSPSVK